MAIKVLVISPGMGFMTDSLVKNLESYEYDVKVVPPNIAKISMEVTYTDVFLLYAEDYVFRSSELLGYIRDYCDRLGKMLFLIGYAREIDEIRRTIPDYLITDVFKRPYAMEELIERLTLEVHSFEEKSGKKNIVLVDSDPLFLKMMDTWLKQKYEVVTLDSGVQILTYLANHSADLIIMEYDMPIISGTQIMQMLRSQPQTRDIPVIFLTDNSSEESVKEAVRLGSQGYILKSTPLDEIFREIVDFFKSKKLNI